MNDAVKKTLLARVYDIAQESPLQHAHKLSKAVGCQVLLKREDLQPVHSFKLRGAYNKMVQLSPAERKKGIIAASAGNHAQGVALSAKTLGMDATIVMPRTTPSIKIDAVKSYGATVVLHGDNYSDAYAESQKLIKSTGKVFVHPFDDPDVIIGQGTIGREILEQAPDVTHIIVPVGGGGLVAGIAQYVKQLKPDVQIIGVEPADSNAMGLSLKAGKRITLDHVGIFADGVAVKQVGENTFKIAQQYVDKIVTVTNDQICAAIKAIFEETRSIVEPAGALAVAAVQHAAFPKTAVVAAICSGANMTFERLQFVTERTLIGSGREAIFAVEMPETPGALQRYCQEVVNGHSITELSYRLHARNSAHVFVGVSIADDLDKKRFISKMHKNGYTHRDLSDDDIAKQHIRHMIGGKSAATTSEKLYEVTFPERPGALGDFLQAIDSKWNISLFHYRGQGGDSGSVIIGFECDDSKSLEHKIAGTGSTFQRVKTSASDIFIS
jgi:threonine dehydratase